MFSFLVLWTTGTGVGQTIESEIRESAKRDYPNDSQMQEFVYKKQISAYRYMTGVKDKEVKQIAQREYLNDYAMQKYTYDNSSLTCLRDTPNRSANWACVQLRSSSRSLWCGRAARSSLALRNLPLFCPSKSLRVFSNRDNRRSQRLEPLSRSASRSPGP